MPDSLHQSLPEKDVMAEIIDQDPQCHVGRRALRVLVRLIIVVSRGVVQHPERPPVTRALREDI